MMDKQQELEARVETLEKKVAELEVQVQAQPSAQTAAEVIQQQIGVLVDLQQKAIVCRHYDTALQISRDIAKMATLAQMPGRR